MPGGRTRELEADALRRTCRSDSLGFVSTEEVEPLDGVIGQERAHDALALALETRISGYNLFATGPPGVGKRTSVEARVREHARARPTPGDWVYVHNFRDPRRPLALALPGGQGNRLAADMRQFLSDARRELTAAFDSDTYSQRQRTVTEPLEREHEAAIRELREQARSRGIGLELTPAGVVTVPLRGLEPMTPADVARLEEPVRRRYQAGLEQLAPAIQAFLSHLRGRQREVRDRLRALDRDVALFAIGHLIAELQERYAVSEKLVNWLDAVQEDVIGNLGEIQALGHPPAGDGAVAFGEIAGTISASIPRYEVNVFTAHDSDGGAPVVSDVDPTYPSLFGRIEQRGVLGGGFVTDHRMLRPGAVHQANGGYLILPAADVLSQPLVWRKLKEVLRTNRIRLENLADQYALFPTATVTPEPIDLDIKVVLVGTPPVYQLAYALDEDVPKLFRVKADYDSRIAWDESGAQGYGAFLSSQVKQAGLRNFDAGAVARVIEHGARLAEDQDWLSTRFVEIGGLAAEADYWADRDASPQVRAAHVERAIQHRIRRSDLIEQRLLEMVADGTLMLDFTGERVGQVNGLAVLELGDYAFGRPVRITASAGPGRGDLVSIDRETELSGHLHDKGFLILAGYLRRRYGGERRIALSAHLAFEQSYTEVDGDSAASAEIYALLSELAAAPVRQEIAVTGSVNQRGELQAIGGVNEKIEGFHRACALRGLTGTQGVLIPHANERNLMLAPEVVESVRSGRFHVWSARTVEEGIELLTGLPAGERDGEGRYPAGTLNARVEERLERWSQTGEDGAAPVGEHAARSDGQGAPAVPLAGGG